MFEIDFDAVEEGEWFQYQDSHFDHEKDEFVFDPPNSDAKVRVRRTNDLISKQVSKRGRVSEIVLNPKSRQMERVSYIKDLTFEQEQKEMDDAFDYAITGLVGFKNKKTGAVLECTREVKLALMKLPAFDRFIGRCLRILNGMESARKEEEEKN